MFPPLASLAAHKQSSPASRSPTNSVSMVNEDQRGQYNSASTFEDVMTCGNSNADQCGQSTHVFVEDSSLLKAAQGFSDNAGQCGQYHPAVGQPPPVCYARLPPKARSDLISVEVSVGALPEGQSVYETTAIPRVTLGLPHGAVLDAWLDSVTKQPHASMQQSIAVAGVEEREVCGTRQHKALGPVGVLRGASNILPACVRSAVTGIRAVTALPGPSAIQHLPACVRSAVPVIQPVTSLPTSLQSPEHDEIAVAKAQPSALSPVLLRVCDMVQPSALPPAQLCETAQPSVCRDQSGDHVDAAALEPLSNWAQRPEPSPCVTRGGVEVAALDPLSKGGPASGVFAPCYTWYCGRGRS